ncbi:MAG: RagB/SusD family nutrient uptake outer membrane protein [Bacteroidales bacterium]|nr:RagB/SusD family nutrient uptake outer membrane protein [Bacteroidales bacterium]
MKTKIFSLLLVLGLMAGSCDLNEEPYGFYSEDNFYKTPADAEASLMFAYNALTFLEYSRGIFYIGELASDNCDVKADEGYGSQQLNNWTADASNETLTYFFKYCFIAINRSNAVIDNVVNSTFDSSIKNRLLGEAYFLRAYNYFSLVRVFGLVPIQKNMVKSISQTSPNMAKNMDELYDFIISDLKQAESLLEVKQKVGRADKVAAQSLLAKVYLTIASSKESGVAKYTEMSADVNKMYEEAAAWSHKVLYDQSQYALDNNLLHIYDVDAPNGSEHIFIMSMDRTGLNEGNYSKIGMMFHPWVDGVPFYLKNPDNSFTYVTNGWEVFMTNTAFYNTFDALDKRKTDLIVTNVYNANGTVTGSVGGKIKYPFTRKYVDPQFVGQKSSAKPYLIRFSDVALTYAEAVGPTADGYLWINKIRNRAGLGDLNPGLSASNFRNAVVQERAWELAFEGHRLYDLRRKAMVVAKDPKAVAAGITEAQAAFYPIPQMEIDLNVNSSSNQ